MIGPLSFSKFSLLLLLLPPSLSRSLPSCPPPHPLAHSLLRVCREDEIACYCFSEIYEWGCPDLETFVFCATSGVFFVVFVCKCWLARVCLLLGMLYTGVLVANAFSMLVDALKHATCQNEFSTHAWRGLAKLAICAMQANHICLLIHTNPHS